MRPPVTSIPLVIQRSKRKKDPREVATQGEATEAIEVVEVEVAVSTTEDPPTIIGDETKKHLVKFCATRDKSDLKLHSIPKAILEVEAEIKIEVGVKPIKKGKRMSMEDQMSIAKTRP
jgi:hypothetical protein